MNTFLHIIQYHFVYKSLVNSVTSKVKQVQNVGYCMGKITSMK